MKTRDAGLLTATSILMVLGGIFGLISGVFAVLGAGELAAAIGDKADFGLLMLGSILAWAGGIAALIAGIIGVGKKGFLGRLAACVVFCSLTVLFSVLGNVCTVSGGGSFRVHGIAHGFVFPLLCLFAALNGRNRV